jgi:hypothetical protein
MSVIIIEHLDLKRFSKSNREYLKDYKQANQVSAKKKIIEKIIENEEKCLQENDDFLLGMQNVNNSKSTREILFLLLVVAPAAIVTGYIVFTFVVAASIISIPIFAALCFLSAALSVKGIGHSRPELDHQERICSEKIQLITELQAELKRLNVPDSEQTMEKSSSSEKLDGKKSNVCFFQPARANEESTDTNNLTSVKVLGFK